MEFNSGFVVEKVKKKLTVLSSRIVDDSEMYDQQKPFHLDELVKISAFLNHLVFKMLWNEVEDGKSLSLSFSPSFPTPAPHGGGYPNSSERWKVEPTRVQVVSTFEFDFALLQRPLNSF